MIEVGVRYDDALDPGGIDVMVGELPFQPLGELDLAGHVPVVAYGVPEECDFFTPGASTMQVGGRLSSA